MKYCLNLCDLLYPSVVNNYSINELIRKADLENDPIRIYLGSSFCSQYFKHLGYFLRDDFIKSTSLPITLTVPIFSQKDLKTGKNLVLKLLSYEAIDEITVNDIGMFDFLKNSTDKKINLGRLFFKDTRDVRIPEYNNQKKRISLLDNLDFYKGISGIEFDLITQNLEIEPLEKITVSVHTPYTYQTTGNICKFASIKKEVSQKFRPNSNCTMECKHLHEFYLESFTMDENLNEVFRFGRAVYFLQNTENLENLPVDRNIVFPLKELSLLD